MAEVEAWVVLVACFWIVAAEAAQAAKGSKRALICIGGMERVWTKRLKERLLLGSAVEK